MKRALITIGCLVAAVVAFVMLFVLAPHMFHSRRVGACTEELRAAVRSGATFEFFTQDRRPDGLMKRYSPQERDELLAHVATRDHTDKNMADVDAMSKRAHTSAVYLFSPMVYVLFFDQESRLREFVCLSN